MTILASGCVSNTTSTSSYESLNRTELNEVADTKDFGALTRSPEVFEGRVIRKRATINDYRKEGGTYHLDIRSTKVVPKPFMGRIDSSRLDNHTLLNKTRRHSDSKATLYIWGVFEGLKEVQLEDESYTSLPYLRVIEIDDQKHRMINMTVEINTRADRVCVGSKCKENAERPQFRVENGENHTLKIESEGFQDYTDHIYFDYLDKGEHREKVFLNINSDAIETYLNAVYNNENLDAAYNTFSSRLQEQTDKEEWKQTIQSRYQRLREKCGFNYGFQSIDTTVLQEDEKYIKYTITAGESPGAFRETDVVKENGEWKLDEIPNAYLTYQRC